MSYKSFHFFWALNDYHSLTHCHINLHVSVFIAKEKEIYKKLQKIPHLIIYKEKIFKINSKINTIKKSI